MTNDINHREDHQFTCRVVLLSKLFYIYVTLDHDSNLKSCICYLLYLTCYCLGAGVLVYARTNMKSGM